jgi:tetratricopeptide (TPR) repeat protein
MPTTSRVEVPKPKDWEELEEITCQIARYQWDANPNRYGKTGQADHGVDVYCPVDDENKYALQCKNSDSPDWDDIKSNLKEAATDFPSEITEYIIVTKSDPDTGDQDKVNELSEEYKSKHGFSVSLWDWERVTSRLTDNLELYRKHYSQYFYDPRKAEDVGFDELSEAYFEDLPLGPINRNIRTGFNLREVRAGHAFERRAEGADATTTEKLIEQLSGGQDTVILGLPGSGKSTVCRSVACRWFEDDRGTVFYRREDADVFDSPDVLAEQIRDGEGHVLVVVEDAIRDAHNGVFEVVERFEDDESVTFLFDSRTNEWTDDDHRSSMDLRARNVQRDTISQVGLHPLNPEECEEMVETFERVAGEELGTTGTALYRQLHGPDDEDDSESADGSGAVGDMLVFAYLLAIYADAGDNESVIGEGNVGIEVIVEDAFEQVHEDATETTARVATLLNFLNVVGLSARREQILSLGTVEDASFGAVKEALSELEDVIHFGRSDGQYRLYHEFWSVLYLERLLKVEEREDAMKHFGASVNPLLGLWGDEDARAAINEELRREAIPEELDEEALEALVSLFVLGLTTMVDERSGLVELLGYGKYGVVEIPEACSDEVEAQFLLSSGHAFRQLGQSDHARQQYRKVASLDDDSVPASWRAAVVGSLGLLAESRGELDNAGDYHRQSLETEREIGDRAGEATSLNNLGIVAESRGELDNAEDYHQQSLEIKREINHRAGEAQSLNNLGNVAQSRGELDNAEHYYEQSLETFRKVGDRAGEAQSLGNLGLVVRSRSELDNAENYHQQSLEIKREINDRAGEATSLNNLGNVALSRGELDNAEDYYEQSLEIEREIGDCAGEATSLNNLGNVALSRGELDNAEDYYEQSLEIEREINDRAGEAQSLNNLGNVALSRGELDNAEDYYEQSLGIKREIGDRVGEATGLGNLGMVAQNRGDLETAQGHFEQAAELFLEIGVNRKALQALSNLTRTLQSRGLKKDAKDSCETGLELAEKIDVRVNEFKRLRAELSDDDETRVEQFYDLAFEAIADTEPAEAIRNLADVWTERDEFDTDSDTFRNCLSAGTILVAYLELLDFSDSPADFPVSTDPADHLTEIADHESELRKAIRPLFDHLYHGGADTTPDELREELLAKAEEAEDDETPSLQDMETLATIRLLSELT